MISTSSLSFKILPLVQVDLDESQIDIQKIKDMCSKGLNIYCPAEDRALAWLNLLSIYPSNPQHWETIVTKSFTNYQNFFKCFVNLSKNNENNMEKMFLLDFLCDDDIKLIKCIESDIERSIPQLLFLINNEGNNCKSEFEEKELKNHIKRIERILFIFAKVYPQYGYIQGFNEIVIPLYYVMYSAINLFFNKIDYVEAISFQALEFLLFSSDLKEFFNLDLAYYISKLRKFDRLFNRNLPKIYKIFKKLGIESIQYAFKWFSIVFTQEHPLPQLLPLWDSIFAHLHDLSSYEYCIGIARIQTVLNSINNIISNNQNKHQITKNKGVDNYSDFFYGQILFTLNNIQIKDIYIIIKNANSIYDSNQAIIREKKRGFLFGRRV